MLGAGSLGYSCMWLLGEIALLITISSLLLCGLRNNNHPFKQLITEWAVLRSLMVREQKPLTASSPDLKSQNLMSLRPGR